MKLFLLKFKDKKLDYLNFLCKEEHTWNFFRSILKNKQLDYLQFLSKEEHT